MPFYLDFLQVFPQIQCVQLGFSCLLNNIKLCFSNEAIGTYREHSSHIHKLCTQSSSAQCFHPKYMSDVSDSLITLAFYHAVQSSRLKSKKDKSNPSQKSSPPPQHNPRPQNLQHQNHPHNPSPPPTRARLNNKRSPAPRLRRRRQIISFRDQRRAKPALLYHRSSRGVAADDDRSAAVVHCCCGGV